MSVMFMKMHDCIKSINQRAPNKQNIKSWNLSIAIAMWYFAYDMQVQVYNEFFRFVCLPHYLMHSQPHFGWEIGFYFWAIHSCCWICIRKCGLFTSHTRFGYWYCDWCRLAHVSLRSIARATSRLSLTLTFSNHTILLCVCWSFARSRNKRVFKVQ